MWRGTSKKLIFFVVLICIPFLCVLLMEGFSLTPYSQGLGLPKGLINSNLYYWLTGHQIERKCFHKYQLVRFLSLAEHIFLSISESQISSTARVAAILPISSQVAAPSPQPPVAKYTPLATLSMNRSQQALINELWSNFYSLRVVLHLEVFQKNIL